MFCKIGKNISIGKIQPKYPKENKQILSTENGGKIIRKKIEIEDLSKPRTYVWKVNKRILSGKITQKGKNVGGNEIEQKNWKNVK